MEISFRERSRSCLPSTCLLMLASYSSLLLAKSTGDLHTPTAYKVLQSYNFPIGILPEGVTGYDLNVSTGEFKAYLSGSCSFSLENSYRLSYGSVINGYISEGKLSGLKGVKVKWFVFWIDIVEVIRSGDDLQFSIGITTTKFPIDEFEECPRCGCGFNCPEPISAAGGITFGVSSLKDNNIGELLH